MGLFGGGNSSTQANTTTNTTTTTTTRDIGFTGQNAVDVLGMLTNGARLSLGDLNGTYTNTLGALANAQREQIQYGYQFGGDTVRDVLTFADNATDRAENMLSNIFNLTRDVSQRALNVSSGQETPIAMIPAATPAQTNAIGEDKTTNTVFLIAAIIGILMAFK